MDKIRSFLINFFITLKGSLYELSFYREHVNTPFYEVVKYLYLLVVLSLIIGSIKTTIFFLPQVPELGSMFNKFKSFFKVAYPENLVLTFKDGELNSNLDYPVYFDSAFLSGSRKEIHFIGVYTKASTDDFLKYNTGILLTKKALISRNDSGGYEVHPYDKKLNLIIDKSKYDFWVAKITPYLDVLPKIAIFLTALYLLFSPFLVAPFVVVGKLFMVLFTTIFFLALAKTLKKNLTYRQLYRIGLYAVTIQVILATIKNLIPNWYTFMAKLISGRILIWIIQLYNNVPNLAYFGLMLYIVAKYVNVSTQSPTQLSAPLQQNPISSPINLPTVNQTNTQNESP